MRSEPESPIPRTRVTGLVLAGGRGRRMGCDDKGLIRLGGRPLAGWVAARLAGQSGQLVVSANRHRAEYRRWGRVIEDGLEAYQGPLVGVAAALSVIDTPYLLTAPCDMPLLPDDVLARLARGLLDEQADVAVAYDGTQVQNLVLLLRREVADGLRQWLHSGSAKVADWLSAQRTVVVDFADCPECFININTDADLARVERLIGRRDHAS